MIGGGAVKSAAKKVPSARMLLLGGDIALMAGRHVAALEPGERRRLVTLLGKRARRELLAEPERAELVELLGRLQPRLFLGSAARRVSPVPIPKRVLFGRRGSAAREALGRRGGGRRPLSSPDRRSPVR